MSLKPAWNYELIAALAAVVIGACALVVSIVQTQVMLKQQAVSVLPFVQWNVSMSTNAADSTGTFELQVVNKGVGPATIEQVVVWYRGKSLPEDSLARVFFYDLLRYRPGQMVSYLRSDLEGGVLMPGERVTMFKTEIPRDGFLLAQQFGDLYNSDALDLLICFKNVYDTRWQVRRENKTMPVSNCNVIF